MERYFYLYTNKWSQQLYADVAGEPWAESQAYLGNHRGPWQKWGAGWNLWSELSNEKTLHWETVSTSFLTSKEAVINSAHSHPKDSPSAIWKGGGGDWISTV